MDLFVYLVLGLLLGWLTSLLVQKHQQHLVLNLVMGVIGAMVGGYLVAPELVLPYWLTAVLGAVVLLAVVHLVRHYFFSEPTHASHPGRR